MHGLQTRIAAGAGVTAAYISMVWSGRERVNSWRTAKRLAAASCTTPEIWLEGEPSEIRAACEAAADECQPD